MLHLKVILLAVFFGMWSDTAWAQFPIDPKPCKYGDAECIKKTITYFLNEKSGGDSSINLQPFDPLKTAKIHIKQAGETSVTVDLTFTNSDILGFSQGKVHKVRGFGKNLTRTNEVQINVKSIKLLGDYEINGNVLILPITGKGKSNMTLVNCNLILRFSGMPYEKAGATYMKVKNVRLDIEPERIYYYFSDLFNGNKALSDNMNLFLNENWKIIFDELYGSVTKVFDSLFESLINNVFSKYPYDKYFTE